MNNSVGFENYESNQTLPSKRTSRDSPIKSKFQINDSICKVKGSHKVNKEPVFVSFGNAGNGIREAIPEEV